MNIQSSLNLLEKTEDISLIKDILFQLESQLEKELPQKDFARFQQLAMYQVNALSYQEEERSVQAAKTRVLQFLKNLPVHPLKES